MSYIMEHENEADRLERQAQNAAYEVADELSGLEPKPGQRVLDAGCGTGICSRHLLERFPSVAVEGCDLSEIRIQQARKLFARTNFRNVRFFTSALESIAAANDAYDHVVCRYVFEHVVDPSPISREFYRVLKPGGEARVVDFDGIIFNFHQDDAELAGMLEELRRGLPMDLYVGRKIPLLLKEAGFADIRWRVQVVSFAGDALAEEQRNMADRFNLALPALILILGSAERARNFRDRYCAQMMKPESTLFFNKFVVTGRKPTGK
jgi:SAM-dependent methyltransferase